jgi:hypothetical protein
MLKAHDCGDWVDMAFYVSVENKKSKKGNFLGL